MLHIIFLILSLIVLVKGSDMFVNFTSKIARKLGVSEFFIGLTIVAIGTSIPELASTIMAKIHGHDALIIGNIIGSNIANTALILGITAIIFTIKTKRNMLSRDGNIMVFAIGLFFLFALDKHVSLLEGLILLLFYFTYILFLIKAKDEEKEYHFKEFVEYFFKLKYITTIRERLLKKAILKKKEDKKLNVKEQKIFSLFEESLFTDFFMTVLSMVAIYLGAKFMIANAITIARSLGISEHLIGLSVIALGTSLPELSVCIAAARKGLGNMVIGNIIGSNIANVLLVLGVASMISPLKTIQSVLDPSFLLISYFSLLIFIRTDWKLDRKEGIMLLLIYATYITLSFVL